MDNGEEWDPEAIRRKKAVQKRIKGLTRLCEAIGQTLAQSVKQSKDLEHAAVMATARRMDAEKALEKHVATVRELVNHYYEQQQKDLTYRLKCFLQQVMVCKTEGLNREARLTDLEQQVREKLHVIAAQDDVTDSDAKDVLALEKAYHACAVPLMAPEMVDGLSYMMEVPLAMADTVQALVGRFVTTSHITSTLTPTTPTPTPTTPAGSGWCGGGPSPATGGAQSSKTRSSSSTSSHQTSSSSSTSKKKNKGKKATPAAAQTPSTPSQRQAPQGKKSASSKKTAAAGASDKEAKKTKKETKKETPKKKASEKVPETKVFSHNQSAAATPPPPRPMTKPVPSDADQSAPSEDSSDQLKPRVLRGRGRAVSGLAAQADGKVWVVYSTSDPHLYLLDSEGGEEEVVDFIHIGDGAQHVTWQREGDRVLVATTTTADSDVTLVRRLQRKGPDSMDSAVLKVLNYQCTGLAAGTTGLAIGGTCTVYWMSWQGGNNQWIVKKSDSTLTSVSSLAALHTQGKEIVCVADQGGEAVHLFRKSLKGRFVPLPRFAFSDRAFAPVSISASPGDTGVLGVLDGVHRDVFIVEVGKEGVGSVRVVDGRQLCDGVPTVLAFRPDDVATGRPAVWVASDEGHVCLTLLTTRFQLQE
ncbi:uncharacterized protein LOC143281945 [Babylonia areolata]|uniref:uncharacterized protein LOC143281945 n=1 Tax=Babylonia areolata TaxID=304850 RepID=UPI003FD264A8